MSFGFALPRALCGRTQLKSSFQSLTPHPSFFHQLSHLTLPPRSSFSTSSAISFPPKPTPAAAYQPKTRPPPIPSKPIGTPGLAPSTIPTRRLRTAFPVKISYHPLSPSRYIPPPPYSVSHHNSLRSLLLSGSISPAQRLELDALDAQLLAYKLVVEEKHIAASVGLVPVDGTYQMDEDLIQRLQEKAERGFAENEVWQELTIPIKLRARGENGYNLVGVTNNTRWLVFPYVIFFIALTLSSFALAAQLTESTSSEASPSYSGFFVTTSLLSFLAFVPWFAAGSLHRLLLHAPKVMDLSPYTTWTTMRAPDVKALFGRKTGLLLGPIDLLVVQTTDSRLALGELADKFRWKPFRAGVGRMWLGMFSHRDTDHFYKSIAMLWISGYLAYAFFNKDDNDETEGVFPYTRRMIGTYFPQYASTTDEEKKEEVESPKLRSTGVYEYAVFVLTAGAFAAFIAQLHHSFILLPKAAKPLHQLLSNPSSIRNANPPWFMVPATKVQKQKLILGDAVTNALGVERAATGLTEAGLALSTVALLSSCSHGGLWIFGSIPALIPALVFSGKYIVKDLTTIKRDWNTPRRHFGAGIAFGLLYFLFGSTFFAWSVSGKGELVIPPYDPNAPPAKEEKKPEVEVDPAWETYVFNGKTIRLPPRRANPTS